MYAEHLELNTVGSRTLTPISDDAVKPKTRPEHDLMEQCNKIPGTLWLQDNIHSLLVLLVEVKLHSALCCLCMWQRYSTWHNGDCDQTFGDMG